MISEDGLCVPEPGALLLVKDDENTDSPEGGDEDSTQGANDAAQGQGSEGSDVENASNDDNNGGVWD